MSQVSPALQKFVDGFYAASDVGPSGHQAYVDYYAPDTDLVMGPNQFKGREGVMKFREAGWEKVATRKHVCKQVFPNPEKPEQEFMLYGTVSYGNKDGTSLDGVEWAARMVLDKPVSANDAKIQQYRVYIVSSRLRQTRDRIR